MLGLPPTTEVKRPLPKAQLFKRFDWTPSQHERSDDEVSRLDFVVWDNIISSISLFYVEKDKPLCKQIKVDEERAKLKRQIAALKLKMRSTSQPRHQSELNSEIKKLKGGLNG